MTNEQVAPETKGVAVELLATVVSAQRPSAWKAASVICAW
jgi:hypothetical protein